MNAKTATSYPDLAKQAHPDQNGGDGSAMVELNRAQAEMLAHYGAT